MPTTRVLEYGGDKEWRHRDRAVGFVDSTGEATSCSEADGLAQEGAKARAVKV